MFRKPTPRKVRLHLKGREESYDGILTHIVRISGLPHYALEVPVMYTPVEVDGKMEIQRHDLQGRALFQATDVLLIEEHS